MTHRIVIRLRTNNKGNSFRSFKDDHIGDRCQELFTTYKNNKWIEGFAKEDVDANTKDHTMYFDSSGRFDLYTNDLKTITGSSYPHSDFDELSILDRRDV